MSDNNPKITVFTPTYNRAYILHKLYDSLIRQSFRSFEWLIVDDGSTDDTEALVKCWIKKNDDFEIRYIKQTNGGKCRAINRALDFAHGKLFFTVDSDDCLTDDALEKVNQWESKLPHNDIFCGVAGNCGNDIEHTPNRIFEGDYYEGTMLDRYKNVDGERAYVFYTEIHKKYRYPEYEGEKFMTEAVVWNRMAHAGYKMRFYNDIIWLYEYQQDGLTKAGNSIFINNPHGYALWLKEKKIFEGANSLQMLKYYYSMYSELCSKYDVSTIADCLQTNLFFVYICRVFYWIKHSIVGRKQKKKERITF